MGKPSEGEARALEESGPLLRFAAEHVKGLDVDLSLAVAEARDAAQKDEWTPQVSQRFWTAFARLCGLVQPVTTDSLVAASQAVPVSGWMSWRKGERRSIAERSSARYLGALLALLLIVLPLQLYVWTSTNLSKKIDDAFAAASVKVVQLAEEYTKLKDRPPAAGGGFDQRSAAFKMRASDIAVDVRRIQYLVKSLERIVTLTTPEDSKWPYIYVRPAESGWERDYDATVSGFETARSDIHRVQQQGNLVIGVIGSFVLPILFGAIGALAFIIRSTSDQIQNSTFSTTSPIRNVMRIALGALAGVVVGLFSDLSSQLSLSPLAIAFLAGYGVEAIFAMFDGLTQKFRQAV
jgi:hypothetical protein